MRLFPDDAMCATCLEKVRWPTGSSVSIVNGLASRVGSRTVQRISVEPHPATLVVFPVVISKEFPSHLRSALVRNWHFSDLTGRTDEVRSWGQSKPRQCGSRLPKMALLRHAAPHDECRFSGLKRKSLGHRQTVANAPPRTWGLALQRPSALAAILAADISPVMRLLGRGGVDFVIPT